MIWLIAGWRKAYCECAAGRQGAHRTGIGQQDWTRATAIPKTLVAAEIIINKKCSKAKGRKAKRNEAKRSETHGEVPQSAVCSLLLDGRYGTRGLQHAS